MCERLLRDPRGRPRRRRADEIKKAYRHARAQVPSRPQSRRQGSAERKFKEASKAYQVLVRRRQARVSTTASAHAAFEGGAGGSAASTSVGFAGASMFEDVLGDLFGDFFGGGRRAAAAARARAATTFATTSRSDFEEAVARLREAASRSRAPSRCEPACGSGAKPGHQPETCPACHGAGQVRFQQGLFQIAKTCGQCNGEGQIIRTPVRRRVAAPARTREMRDIKVKVPGGRRRRLASEAARRRRGRTKRRAAGRPLRRAAGRARTRSSTATARNIVCELPVSMVQAALGAEIDVPTLDGVVKLEDSCRHPARQGLSVCAARACRICAAGRARRPVRVRVIVETPTHLSKQQKKLLKEFEEAGNQAQESLVASFARKVRDLFGSRG